MQARGHGPVDHGLLQPDDASAPQMWVHGPNVPTLRANRRDANPPHMGMPALYGGTVDCLKEWDCQVLNPLLEPEQVVPWNPEQIYKFIVESNSEVLLVDNEEY